MLRLLSIVFLALAVSIIPLRRASQAAAQPVPLLSLWTMAERSSNPLQLACIYPPPADPPFWDIARRSLDPHVRPETARRLERLRPEILHVAHYYNNLSESGLSDEEFAATMTLILYNEQNGWFEDALEVVRPITPFYQQLQVIANESGIGTNFSVWPTNLRPSVAMEIMRHQVPVPGSTRVITTPLLISPPLGGNAPLNALSSNELSATLTRDLTNDQRAIEYLGANLARGVFRARYEGINIGWWTLAAWHNQGLVRPSQITNNVDACTYVYRSSVYMPAAWQFVQIGMRQAARRQRWMVPPVEHMRQYRPLRRSE